MEFILSHDTDVHVYVILGWLLFSLILACVQTAILILHFDSYKIFLYLTTQSLCRSGGGDVPFHLSNVGKCNKAFGHLMGTVAYRALVIVGKMEDQGLNVNCCIICNKTTFKSYPPSIKAVSWSTILEEKMGLLVVHNIVNGISFGHLLCCTPVCTPKFKTELAGRKQFSLTDVCVANRCDLL